MIDHDTVHEQQLLIAALAAQLRQLGEQVSTFETHISWVLVAGRYAYKFKKPVCFDFVDFSTLASRHHYCLEELRLNRRLAPELYLAVVAVGGTVDHPVLDSDGEAIDYAVKMRAFPQEAIWTERIRAGTIVAAEADLLARKLARFHATAAVAPAASDWGSSAAVGRLGEDDLRVIGSLLPSAQAGAQWRRISALLARRFKEVLHLLDARKALGSIRECHGDLHSANIVTIGGDVTAFDCIEFNDRLRWIDVLDDIAFLCMDLRYRERPDLAARCLNAYLEETGDYPGLPALRYYETARALVRCKVALLRAAQMPGMRDAEQWQAQAASYLRFALAMEQPASPSVLMITHGFSGSGKSTFAQSLVDEFGAIRLRSDVERKRLHGLDPHAGAAAALQAGVYAPDASASVYARLWTLAASVIAAGRPVVVDAAFLKRAQRDQFLQLAKQAGVPFLILDVYASPATLRDRVVARACRHQDPSDAGLAVLDYQLATHEALGADERGYAMALDGACLPRLDKLRQWLNGACVEGAIWPPPDISAIASARTATDSHDTSGGMLDDTVASASASANANANANANIGSVELAHAIRAASGVHCANAAEAVSTASVAQLANVTGAIDRARITDAVDSDGANAADTDNNNVARSDPDVIGIATIPVC